MSEPDAGLMRGMPAVRITRLRAEALVVTAAALVLVPVAATIGHVIQGGVVRAIGALTLLVVALIFAYWCIVGLLRLWSDRDSR